MMGDDDIIVCCAGPADHKPGDDDGVGDNEIRTNTYWDWSVLGIMI